MGSYTDTKEGIELTRTDVFQKFLPLWNKLRKQKVTWEDMEKLTAKDGLRMECKRVLFTALQALKAWTSMERYGSQIGFLSSYRELCQRA